MRHVVAAILFFILVSCPVLYAAEQPPPHFRISNIFGVGLNPPVLGDIFKFYQRVPMNLGENFLFSEANLREGFINTLSPKFDKIGAFFGISPLLILDFEFVYQAILNWSYYEFDSYNEKYDDAARSHMTPRYETGHYFLAETQLRAKVYKVVLVHFFGFEYWYGPTYWFSDEFGTILKSGPAFRNKTFLMWEFDPTMRFFLNYENHQYPPSGYRRQLVSMGVYADKIFAGHTGFIVQAGYHLENPDWKGLLLLVGILSDFPIKGGSGKRQ